MAVKTFSVSEVLTASDTNTYLANSGLVYVAAGSFTGATSFDVTGFSSTYKYFRLEFSTQRVDTSGNAVLYGQLYNGATARTTGYYASAFFSSYLGSTGVGYTSNNGSNFMAGLADSGGTGLQAFDIFGMTSANFTLTGNAWDVGSARQYMIGANHFVNETNDKIRFSASAGTMTGTWRLYGYREP